MAVAAWMTCIDSPGDVGSDSARGGIAPGLAQRGEDAERRPQEERRKSRGARDHGGRRHLVLQDGVQALAIEPLELGLRLERPRVGAADDVGKA